MAWCIKRLLDTGILDRTPTEIDRARIARRLAQSQAWVENYANENRVKLLDELAPEVASQLESRDREALRTFAARVASFFFSSRRRHTRFDCDWSSDVCSSD